MYAITGLNRGTYTVTVVAVNHVGKSTAWRGSGRSGCAGTRHKKYQDVVGWLLCSPPGTVSRRLLSCKLQLSISSEPEVLASGSNYVPPHPRPHPRNTPTTRS